MIELKIENTKDLMKVGEVYDKIEDLIHGSDLSEDIIEMMQKPLVDILTANHVSLEEKDF